MDFNNNNIFNYKFFIIFSTANHQHPIKKFNKRDNGFYKMFDSLTMKDCVKEIINIKG